MIKHFGDYAIDFTNRTSDDEYHAAKTHESNTVSMWAMPLAGLFGATVLAWVLPGMYATVGAIVVLAVMLTSQQAGLYWMKNYAPRPKVMSPPKYMAAGLILGIAMMVGIIWNAALAESRSWPMIAGMIVGAIVGAVIATVAVPRNMKKDYTEDKVHLDAELED